MKHSNLQTPRDQSECSWKTGYTSERKHEQHSPVKGVSWITLAIIAYLAYVIGNNL